MLPALSTGSAAVAAPDSQRSPHAWRELEWVVLALLVAAIYFSRLTDLTIRGEESRWARVAQEMIDTGDWIVPRQQGAPFPDRPPLNSWAMIAASKLTGKLDLAAVRLPTATATLLVTLLVYFYGRNFLSRVGAFAAAAAYPTMAQVLQLGRLAESDSLLTLCVSGALLSWHYGYARRASARFAWTAGYALAAMAGLAKGPQGPVYFMAITTVFLALRRDWLFLFNRWHLAGLGLLIAIIGAWQVPFFVALGPASVEAIWSEGGEVGRRFHYGNLRTVLAHWGAYPFEVLASTMPWSLMLLVLPTRWFRGAIGEARPLVAFALTACAVAFPTCWLPSDSRARYFMSLYPCLALLIGLAIQRCWESEGRTWWQRSWDRYLSYGFLIVLAAGVVVLVSKTFAVARLANIGGAISTRFAVLYALVSLVAAGVMLWTRRRHSLLRAEMGIATVAAFMGITYAGVVVSVQSRTSNDPSPAIAMVRGLIPEDERLLSFGPVHHLFAYYYQQPIALEKARDGKAPTDFSNTYFCYVDDPFFDTPEITFPWQSVAEISCERSRSKYPLTKVVVGKRITATAQAPPHAPIRAIVGADEASEPADAYPLGLELAAPE